MRNRLIVNLRLKEPVHELPAYRPEPPFSRWRLYKENCKGLLMKTVLILCTGNSCRSVMAEGLLNHWGRGRFKAFSAGSFPTGQVNPMSLQTLARHGLPTDGYRSKSWNEFTDQPINIVITVCDAAAGESCPLFPGGPVKAHWGVPDPAHAEGTAEEVTAFFDRVYAQLECRVKALVALPVETMPQSELAAALASIGKDEL